MVTQNDLVSASSSQVTTIHLSHSPLIMCVCFCWLRSLAYSLILLTFGHSWPVFFPCFLSVCFFECPPFLPKLAIDSFFPISLAKIQEKESLLGLSESSLFFLCNGLWFEVLDRPLFNTQTGQPGWPRGRTNPCFNQLSQRYQPVHSRTTFKKVSKVYFLNGYSGLRSFLKRRLWVYISKTYYALCNEFWGKVDLPVFGLQFYLVAGWSWVNLSKIISLPCTYGDEKTIL